MSGFGEVGQFLFLSWLFAHLVADFVLQSDSDVERKSRPVVFLRHIGIVTALAWVVPGHLGLWWPALVIGASHALIDYVKVRFRAPVQTAFWADQAAHVVVIFVLAGLLDGPGYGAGASWWCPLVPEGCYPAYLAGATGFVVNLWVGGVVIGLWTAPYLTEIREVRSAAEKQDQTHVLAMSQVARGLARGGRAIGHWERALIFFLVMIGRPESVAFLAAAKSIFRFGELKDRDNRMEAEYITIGTLMSFTWGLVTSWATLFLIESVWPI